MTAPKEIYIYVGKNHVSNHWTSERFDEKTDMKYLSESHVKELLAEKDKEIKRLKQMIKKPMETQIEVLKGYKGEIGLSVDNYRISTFEGNGQWTVLAKVHCNFSLDKFIKQP